MKTTTARKDENAVVVSGAIEADDVHKQLLISSFTSPNNDKEGDVIIHVETVSGTGTNGNNCSGIIEYTATLEYNRAPDTLVVWNIDSNGKKATRTKITL